MSDDQKNEEDEQLKPKTSNNDDDLQFYLKEIEILESDFSDLDDLDFEEIQEMQEAIAKVKESEESTIDAEGISEIESERREDLINDFSDIDEIDFDELKEMQQAIESVKQEELVNLEGQESGIETSQEISKELEDRIKKELSKRKEVEEEVITPERFSEYVKNKRDKIVIATKCGLDPKKDYAPNPEIKYLKTNYRCPSDIFKGAFHMVQRYNGGDINLINKF